MPDPTRPRSEQRKGVSAYRYPTRVWCDVRMFLGGEVTFRCVSCEVWTFMTNVGLMYHRFN